MPQPFKIEIQSHDAARVATNNNLSTTVNAANEEDAAKQFATSFQKMLSFTNNGKTYGITLRVGRQRFGAEVSKSHAQVVGIGLSL